MNISKVGISAQPNAAEGISNNFSTLTLSKKIRSICTRIFQTTSLFLKKTFHWMQKNPKIVFWSFTFWALTRAVMIVASLSWGLPLKLSLCTVSAISLLVIVSICIKKKFLTQNCVVA